MKLRDLVTNGFLELSYEESLLLPLTTTAPMLCILTFVNNLIPDKYLLPLPGNFMFPTSGEMAWDLVTNRFLELSYEESLLLSHKTTAHLLSILSFGNNLLPGKYLFPLLGNSNPLP